MNDPIPPLYDPPLKQAMRDLARDGHAPAMLRERVARAMAAATVETEALPLTRSGAPRGKLRRWLTMAATIAIGVTVGIAVFEWFERSSKSPGNAGEYASGYARPGLWAAMVTLHETRRPSTAPALDAETPLVAPLTDPAALANEASTRLKRRVPRPVLGEGWTLDGASFCEITDLPSVRFHFVRDGRAVTIVSLPDAAWTGGAVDSYCTRSGEHAIAGYVKDDGLHCVIGDPTVSLSEVETLTRQLRTQ